MIAFNNRKQTAVVNYDCANRINLYDGTQGGGGIKNILNRLAENMNV